MRTLSALSLVLACVLAGCQPGVEERERMAAEMQAAAPEEIEGYHYNRGGLLDDAALDLYVSDGLTTEALDDLACGVLTPILQAHGETSLSVDLWLDRGNGLHLGEVHEICLT